MKSVSWMKDYFPARMLGLAMIEECRFGECLMDCPRDGDVIRIDSPDDLKRLVDTRVTSLLLSMAALEAYLGYYAYRASERLGDKTSEPTFSEYLEQKELNPVFKEQPNKIKRRHQYLVEVHGDKPVTRFLNSAGLTLEEKIFYYPLMRAGKPVSTKDGNVKKVLRLFGLHEELRQLDLAYPPEEGKVGSVSETKEISLSFDLPDAINIGKTASDEYVVEDYGENHFVWELLHCYPPRAVAEFSQYLHTLDNSDHHFMSVLTPVELVDENGRPVTEEIKKYRIEINLEK